MTTGLTLARPDSITLTFTPSCSSPRWPRPTTCGWSSGVPAPTPSGRRLIGVSARSGCLAACLCFSLSLIICLCLSLLQSVCLPLSHSVFMHVPSPLSLPAWLFHVMSFLLLPSQYVSLALYLSFLFLSLSLKDSVSLYLYVCLSESISPNLVYPISLQ